MKRLSNLEGQRPGRWRALVILIAVCALTVSVATRYYSPVSVSAPTIKTLQSHSLRETSRQRLTKDAATWVPTLVCSVTLQPPTFYPRVAPAGPLVPSVLLERSLYTRPPPRAEFLI